MQTTRKYGLYAGLIFSAALLLLSFTKVENPGTTLNYSFLICFPFLIFYILKAMLNRRKELGNHIDFNEAFKMGLGVSALAGIVYGFFNYLYLKFVNHKIIETMIESQRLEMAKQHKTIEEINDRLVSNITNRPFAVATTYLVTIIFIGGIISIILALIVRRKHIEVLTETE
jgi:hypothetical protein